MECGILLFFLAASAVGFGEGRKAAITGIYMSNSLIRFPRIGSRETVDLNLFAVGVKMMSSVFIIAIIDGFICLSRVSEYSRVRLDIFVESL